VIYAVTCSLFERQQRKGLGHWLTLVLLTLKRFMQHCRQTLRTLSRHFPHAHRLLSHAEELRKTLKVPGHIEHHTKWTRQHMEQLWKKILLVASALKAHGIPHDVQASVLDHDLCQMVSKACKFLRWAPSLDIHYENNRKHRASLVSRRR